MITDRNYKYSLDLISICPLNEIDEHNIESLRKHNILSDSILMPDNTIEEKEFEIISKWNHYFNKDAQIQKKYICGVTVIEITNPYTVSTIKSYTEYICDIMASKIGADALWTQWDNPLQSMRFESKDYAYNVLSRNIRNDAFRRSGTRSKSNMIRKVVGFIKPIYESKYLHIQGQQFLYLNLKDIMKATLEYKYK